MKTQWSDEQILQAVREEVADTLKIPLDEVTANSVLTDDLDAVSIDFVDIMFRLEARFQVKFHPGNPLDRMAEGLEPGALSRDGMLTELGAEAVRKRMPEIDGQRVVAGMPGANVQALYTTGTWARAVRELLDAEPQTCPACGGDDLEPVGLAVRRCRSCEAQVLCPTQAELLSGWAAKHMRAAPDGAAGPA